MSWWISRITVGLLLVAVLAFFGTMFRIYLAARSDDMGPAGAIVVLGAAQFNGVPSRVFQARLDTAYELYQAGVSDLIVVTGGRLPGDVYTEGESGQNYLIDRGIPPESILMEHISSNTEESVQRVSVMLKDRGIDDVLLVSDGFHLYRAQVLAEENGLTVQTNDADDSPIVQGSGTEFRYVVRETFAVLAHRFGLD
ncbi:MAG: YdcF family protein [Thermomicrobiales bacterium]|nr:YdcF family protein [Thermomicrobiales bacterium]